MQLVRKRGLVTISVLTLFLAGVCGVFLAAGSVDVGVTEIVSILLERIGVEGVSEYGRKQQIVIEQIRLPRLVLGGLVGAGLAISGAVMQGLFRNPLADPGLLGISAGAALGAVTVIVFGSTLFAALELGPVVNQFSIPVAAFAGGFIATTLVFRFGLLNGKADVAIMLLAGIAINAIAGATASLFAYLATDPELRNLVFWSLGSLSNAGWTRLVYAAPIMLIGICLIPLYARTLNAVLLGESEAQHLGFDLERTQRMLILLVALVVGAAVSVSGIIGFVGLVVPHLLRLIVGPDHRLLLPASALLGAAILISADLLSRTVIAPAELPVGIVTAILGGPFFLALLMQRKRRHAL